MFKLTGVLVVSAVVASSLLLPAVASPAASTRAGADVIYSDVGRDLPDLLSDDPMTAWADVLKTSRVLVQFDAGRALKVKVIARRDFPIPRRVPSRDLFQLVVSLDSRSGPGSEYRFQFYARGRCELKAGIDARIDRCRTWATESGALVMRSPTRYLDITKHVRWVVMTYPGTVGDAAPDHGWYS